MGALIISFERGQRDLPRRCRVENGEEEYCPAEVFDFDALDFLDFCSKKALV
ncbi:hypothetical protein A2U01_0117100 [Trifolium medium]|uniref:Uncharacterized protein n=1 Tax=Trifolium medium TaxID=97028 RepID=A0A392W9I0_9FABA|nr:hypothetical protein [Trifolium medium]